MGNLYGLDTWGHVLTDCLRKLWFLSSPEGKSFLAEGYKPVYIAGQFGNDIPAYAKKIFLLAGFDSDEWEHITVPTRFSCVVVPDSSFISENGSRTFTREYSDIIKKICATVQADAWRGEFIFYEKIYLTRTGIKSHKDFGEKRVEKAFERAGYTVISPEKYSVEQQIYFMARAKEVVATEGSIAHNAVFCGAGTKLVVLRKANYINDYQLAINEAADLNVTYIDANRSNMLLYKYRPWLGPFYIYITKPLKKFLSLRFSVPFFLSAEYWRYVFYGIYNRLRSKFKK